jgi:hypothetical protein
VLALDAAWAFVTAAAQVAVVYWAAVSWAAACLVAAAVAAVAAERLSLVVVAKQLPRAAMVARPMLDVLVLDALERDAAASLAADAKPPELAVVVALRTPAAAAPRVAVTPAVPADALE